MEAVAKLVLRGTGYAIKNLQSANSKESKEFQRKFKKEKINQENWKKSGFELLTGTVRIQT